MASLTGCLTDDESSVDETTDTTSDSTGNTNQDGTIDPVGSGGGYSPPETANITVFTDSDNENYNQWVAKNGNKLTSSCISNGYRGSNSIKVYDNDMTLIFVANNYRDYGVEGCNDFNGI